MSANEPPIAVSIAKTCHLFSHVLDKAFLVAEHEDAELLKEGEREDLREAIEHAHLQIERLYFQYFGITALKNDEAQRPKVHLVETIDTPS